MSARHLVLIGLMGAGKTTVGTECAHRLGRPFVDTDAMVEATAGASVAEIFRAEGESEFRSYERVAVSDAAASPEPLVIGCGGGVAADAANRAALRATGCVIWLQAPPETLDARVRGGDRPLLATGDAVATLRRLAAQREAGYEAAAHLVVDTNGRDVDEVATVVLEEYAQWNA